MPKIVFDPSTVAKSADVNSNFEGTWNGTLMDDGFLKKRHFSDEAQPDVRSLVQASVSTLTMNVDDYEYFVLTAQAQNFTIANPTGSPEHGKGILIRFKDNGTARSISYGSQFREIGLTRPVVTVANKTMYLAARWNATDTKWDLLSVGREA